MPQRTASARWQGSLQDGQGTMRLGSGAYEGQYSFASRFEDGTGTNPEELLGAAHAGCFSMALSSALSKAGHVPDEVSTTATVHLEKVGDGFTITRIDLACDARVPGVDESTFLELAEGAKKSCPVSRALAATEITLETHLAA
jgi:lipoyl-dependent peroxiredoxin